MTREQGGVRARHLSRELLVKALYQWQLAGHSVAELSAHLSLPLGVVRVLVGDLADEGLVVVHTGSPTAAPPAANLKVLESVLDGISAL